MTVWLWLLIGIALGVLLYRYYARWILRDLLQKVQPVPRRLGPLFPTLHSLYHAMRDQVSSLQDRAQQLADSLQALQAIFHHLGVPFLIVDVEGRLTFWNPAAQQLLGLPAPADTTGPVYYWMAAFDAFMQERLQRFLRHPENAQWLWDRSEDRNTYEVTARVLQTNPLQVALLIVNRSVEARLSQYKAEVIAQLTHDLRTPVTTLAQAVELLRQEPLPAERAEFVDIIERQVQRLQQFVERVEALYQAERPEPVEPPQVVSLSDVLRRVVQDLERAYRSKQITIEADIAPDVCIRGWPPWVETLCVNLLDNALKFSPQGRRVWVRLARVNGRAVLTVRDEGPGIPSDEQGRIFERFFRGRWAVQMGVPGSGLGLSIVKHIVLRHGGDIQVRSTLGAGTEFVVTLPSVERGTGDESRVTSNG
jgi:signal transduction histidine kinase